MAHESFRSCDVMKAAGKLVEATEEVKLTIPAFAVPDNTAPDGHRDKPLRVALDVSPEGKKRLHSMVASAEKSSQQAFAPVLEVVAKRDAANGKWRKRSKPSTTEPTADEAPVEDGQVAPQH